MENEQRNNQAQPFTNVETSSSDEMAIRWHMAYDLLREIAAREQNIPLKEDARAMLASANENFA